MLKNEFGLTRRKFIRGAAYLVPLPWMGKLVDKPSQTVDTHRLLCCNIRVDLPEDEEKGFGWSGRKNICRQVIASRNPDIICLQEVLKSQMDDLATFFPAYAAFGFEGPEMDVRQVGYHGIAKNPIMFLRDRYELVSAGTFWLSESPLIAGSMSWDTARARHANWVRLQDKQTKKQFRVINLHLDHRSQPAKEGQIKLVLEEAAQYTESFPQLLAGDFNAHMENVVYQHVLRASWTDTFTALHGSEEPGHTVHLFQGDQYVNKDRGRKIDFIFGKGNVEPVAAEIIRDHVDGKYPSDHYFVSADVTLI